MIRQVTKLVTGVGVDYTPLARGRRVSQGRTCDSPGRSRADKRGRERFRGPARRDLGNGWLLNHPLQKMILFRDHLAATKLPGKARKKTKAVPRAPSSDDDDDDDEAAAAPPRPATGKARTRRPYGPYARRRSASTKGKSTKPRSRRRRPALEGSAGRRAAVRKRFPGSGWFDGVIESVEEDGRCEIAWSDGDVTSMKVRRREDPAGRRNNITAVFFLGRLSCFVAGCRTPATPRAS